MSVAAGIVSVLVPDACCNEAMTGVVKVLFVRVSVVSLPTNVSVAFGKVTVLPELAELVLKIVVVAAVPTPNFMSMFAVEIVSPTNTDFTTPKPPSV